MRLKSVKLRGFKSFAESAAIETGGGINVIVGPNGCGKSNISDAIRWALGERSPRSLRCAKMQDALFNGGSNQKPANAAEVSILFSNEEKSLPIDSPMVTVTRRLRRSGESSYLLNGVVCKRQDIYELFMDTGVGRNAYSLMEQGNIDRLLTTRPEDRRSFFDEVAGITKYKYQKKEALKKLESADQNLVSINAMIVEMESRTEALRRQAESALALRERKEILRILEIELARRRWLAAQARLTEEEEAYETADLTIKTSSRELERLGSIEEEEARRRDQLASKAQTARGHVQKIEVEIARVEGDIGFQKDRRQRLMNNREGADADIEKLRKQVEQISEQIAEKERGREQAEIELQTDKGRLKGRTRALEALDKQIADSTLDIDQLERRIVDIDRERMALENSLSSISGRAENSAARHTSLEERIARIEASLKEARSTLERLQDRSKNLSADGAVNAVKLTELEEQISATESALRKAESERRGFQEQLAKSAAEARTLENLASSYRGYYQGVTAVARVGRESPETLPGVCGVVAELISCEEMHERAIEAALGSAAQNIIMETAEDAKRAIQFLRQHRAGRATFLPLDILYSRYRKDAHLLRYPGAVGWAPDLIRTDARYWPAVENLLGGVIVMETLDDAIRLSRRERTRFRLATLEGELVYSGGAISGGREQRRSGGGLLQRPRELEALKAKIGQLSASLQEKERQRVKLESDLEQMKKERADRQEKLQSAAVENASLEKEIEQTAARQKDLEDELEIEQDARENLEEDAESIAQSREEKETELADKEKELKTLQRRASNLKEQRAADSQSRSELQEAVSALKVDIASRQGKLDGFEGEMEALKNRQEDARRQIADNERAAQDHDAAMEELEAALDKAQRNFLILESKRMEHAQEADQLEEERAELETEGAKRQKTMRRLEGELERAKTVRYDHDVKMVRLRERAAKTAERIQEKYRVPVDDLQPNEEAPENDAEAAEEAKRIAAEIERMGRVNEMAAEEYEDHRGRLDQLLDQRDDLTKARNSIRSSIRKIDAASQERFAESFEQIRGNYQEVFAQLFGGGETELRLTDPANPLESGVEIMASPPGKRPESIAALSGGERSLVAIALLFAVFKLRPSPFCVLDEVDAALDEANVLRFTNLIQDYAKTTQFIVITHNNRTMEKADILYGVTMEKAGVSKILSIPLSPAEEAP
ncbi:MAG: chromosome segregation protein SMC [Candidatus Poribacteria bacterium]|nr:chromosome segregation protein SMC [Candidatus Poribacteria bacterium]